jgi:periplasmic protein TonB
MMFTRYASAVTTGTFVTFGLLFVMQLLVTLQPGVKAEPRPRFNLTPFKMERDDTPVQPREQLPPREKLTNTELPPARPTHATNTGPIGVHYPTPTAPTNGNGIPTIGLYNDGPLVALVRVAPVYPTRAIARELEGYVVVQFDVAANGQVTSVIVIESSDSIFNAAAIQAAGRFKFKPRVVDGVPLATLGIQNMFRFRLDD